jgi:signal recognition particle subunit SRP68
VHAFIVYQLLSRRIERDLLLASALLNSHTPPVAKGNASSSKSKKEQVDARLYPAVVKLLDTILQSLEQMRTLSTVDDSPDLASAVDARISFTKARR